jgi:NAD(P)H dehydrogenase (quinone)
MKVLTVYAHPNPKSFCHAVLERFSAGLQDGGHTCEVVDLYAMRFDPVFKERDSPSYITGDTPLDVLERMDLKQYVLDSCRNPLQRFMARRWLRGKDLPAVARAIHDRRPKDVIAHQEKVAAADALAFIAPVFFVGFPAILKGWIERVFTLGFAYELTSAGWAGDVGGRIPLLKHEKALIINTTLFDAQSYAAGIGQAMERLMDDWCLRFPGIKHVEHVYFYALHGADVDTRGRYLERAYQLGKDFSASPRHEMASSGRVPVGAP